MLNKIFSLLLPAVLCSSISFAQQTVKTQSKPVSTPNSQTLPKDLYKAVFEADSALFNAVNTCDTATYKKYMAPDLEFYHDLGGLTVGIDDEIKSIIETCARGTHIRRELIKSTLEVHPIKGYGAIEIASHNFYHTNPGQQEKFSGIYKFVHVWQFKDGQWTLKRIISYGHENVHNN